MRAMAQAVNGARVFNTFLSVGNRLDNIVSFLGTGAVNSLDNALTSGPLDNARSVKHLSVYFTKELTLRSARAVTHRQVAFILRESPPRPQLASRPAWQTQAAGFDRFTARELAHCVHFWSFRFRPVFHAETVVRDHTWSTPIGGGNTIPFGPPRRVLRACREGYHISGGQRATIRALPDEKFLRTTPLLPPDQMSFFPRMPYCTPQTFQARGRIWVDDTCTDVAHAFRQVPLKIQRSATSLDSVVDRELIKRPLTEQLRLCQEALLTGREEGIVREIAPSGAGSSGDRFQ